MNGEKITELIDQFQKETGAELSWNIVASSFGTRRGATLALSDFIAAAITPDSRCGSTCTFEDSKVRCELTHPHAHSDHTCEGYHWLTEEEDDGKGNP